MNNVNYEFRLRDRCIDAAATVFGVTPDVIKRGRRHREITLARHAIVYSLCEEARFSLVKVGKLMKRDHTSIMYARDKAEQRIAGASNDTPKALEKFALAIGACRREIKKALVAGETCSTCSGSGKVFYKGKRNGEET